MKFLRLHGKLVGVLCLMLLGIGGLLQGSVEENILALVPRPLKQQISLFEHSPLSQKLIVIAQAPSAEQAQEVANQTQQALEHAGFINIQAQSPGGMITGLLSNLPGLFSPKIQQETAQKISPTVVTQQFARYYEELFSFPSMLATQRIEQDPFNLTEIIVNRWAEIGQGVQSLNYTNGFLANDEGTTLAGLYNTKSAVSDIAAARRLEQFFTHFQSLLPPHTRVFFMGGIRYTLENALLIKRDLMIVTWAGLLCLTSVFICFFRSKRALLIYLLPLLVLPPAAWIVQLIFGHISGITLGFGSVVVGLSVDYAIYIYFALQSTQATPNVTVSKITKHLWCNFLTSGLCFIALFFSSIEVFKQIAVFALIALALAFLIAVQVFPIYFKGKETTPFLFQAKANPLSFPWAIGASILLVGFGMWGLSRLSLNSNLNALNSTSHTFMQDKQIAEQLFSSHQGALLFSLGKTQEEALARNEQLSSQIPGGLPISELFVPTSTREQNLNRWKNFWNQTQLNTAQQLVQAQALQYGFNNQAFVPFWEWLQNFPTHSNLDFSSWYNPIIQLPNGSYAVVNIVPNEPVYAKADDGIHSVFISASALQADLVQYVKREALKVVGLALLLNLIAVWLLFRNIKETLLCFVPVILGGCFLFGCLTLFKIQVNLFGLIFLPLLIGLGLDYAIFQLIKYRSKQEDLKKLYPMHALLAAGLSTLAGFGVLVLAKHAVLFMMGLCALVGIGGTIFAAVFILPALRKHYI